MYKGENGKMCRTCGAVLHIKNFHKDKKSPDGHRNSCMECRNAKKRKPKPLNPHSIKLTLGIPDYVKEGFPEYKVPSPHQEELSAEDIMTQELAELAELQAELEKDLDWLL